MYESWRNELFQEFGKLRKDFPATYRDEWPEELERKRQIIWEDLRRQAEGMNEATTGIERLSPN